jgi:pimeloyl-ACP methyl ester carboxylesterase
VRSRRVYFDCRFGQLHVRTAFPTTGGFDEQVTLFCLHPALSSSRVFSHFLPLLAAQRSVYAPDLPGCGESDPATSSAPAEAAAAALVDLAADLRLRQIDVLGLREGSEVAIELALARRDLVRRVVLIGGASSERIGKALPQVETIDAADFPDDASDAASQDLVRRIDRFLCR